MNRFKWLLFVSVVIGVVLCNSKCSRLQTSVAPQEAVFRNLSDSAQYVGMQTCMQCHSGIHQSYLRTGMGKSFGKATTAKSAARFHPHNVVHDTFLDYSYFPFWKGDSLVFREFKMNGNDTIYSREQHITYIVGSGQHTNSHIVSENGYLFQAPLTFYTQTGKWDLPPGFENGANSRFNRIIGLECISCHNAYPGFVAGSENKFVSVPGGIDCERCHGPGSLHVTDKQRGIIVDTSRFIDYSIVNPAKLSVDLQFDLCQRCHLQGNAVLADGKSFLDFRPGMKLSDVMDVYLPRYSNSGENFIMASHADRLKQSACFKSMEKKHVKAGELRPYKSALTCVTCHNPHVSVQETSVNHFNNQCTSCHKAEKVKTCPNIFQSKESDCVSCHMPQSSSSDIPHVSIHDHYIRKTYKKPNAEQGRFVTLESINNPDPSTVSQIRAYLQQFEKFNPDDAFLLDSAEVLLRKAGGRETDSLFRLYIQLDYLRNDFKSLISFIRSDAISDLLYFKIGKRDYSNTDAWTSYRIAEAYSQTGIHDRALVFYWFALRLAPHYFEFGNKLGSSALVNGQTELAERTFRRLILSNPGFAPAWSNLSYLALLKSDFSESLKLSEQALKLDYNYIQARLNRAAALQALGKLSEMRKEIDTILQLDPSNAQALRAKQSLYQ